jgi:hypothetical protein
VYTYYVCQECFQFKDASGYWKTPDKPFLEKIQRWVRERVEKTESSEYIIVELCDNNNHK